MLSKILTDGQEGLLAEERALLVALDDALRGLGGVLDLGASIEAGLDELATARRTLDPLLLVAVVGAPGSRVDLLADALLGRAVLTGRPGPPEGGPPRLVRRPRPMGLPEEAGGIEVVASEAPALEWIALVSSPEGAPEGWHGEADLALVLTSASRPLTEPEREILRAAGEGAASLMIVVDDVDMLRLSEDVGRMEEAVAAAAEPVLGRRPPTYGIATERIAALPAPAASLVGALARQVEGALRAPEVVEPKLRRAAEAACALAERVRLGVEESLRELAEEVETVAAIEAAVGMVDETARTTLAEGEEEVDATFHELAEGLAELARRWTRPFRVRGTARLVEEVERGPVAVSEHRLAAVVAAAERGLAEAAERASERIEERLAAHPLTAPRRPRFSPRGEGREPTLQPDEPEAPDRLAGLDGADWRALLAPLRRDSLVALGLVVAGVLFAAVPTFWWLGGSSGGGLLTVALGGGLGGASVLAALGMLDRRRRRLVEAVGRRADPARTAARTAFRELVEARAERVRQRVLRPVAASVAEITRVAGAAETGRNELLRLEAASKKLLDRLS